MPKYIWSALVWTLWIALPLTITAQALTMNLDQLVDRAEAASVLKLSGTEIQAFTRTLAAGTNTDTKQVAQVLENVRVLEIYNLDFSTGPFHLDELDPLRQQATSAGWDRVFASRERETTNEIYLFKREGEIDGMLILAAEPLDLTVVYVEGSFDLTHLEEVVSSSIEYELQTTIQGAAR